ncbi:hypothetical protein PUN28_013592 [Cardiocondyla obscurior]|uniref:Uncharacterized protein n=1 Tax=Cardiocondyla obscurior TaxID=286306 RepID=A0AAW2F5B1_9HYME
MRARPSAVVGSPQFALRELAASRSGFQQRIFPGLSRPKKGEITLTPRRSDETRERGKSRRSMRSRSIGSGSPISIAQPVGESRPIFLTQNGDCSARESSAILKVQGCTRTFGHCDSYPLTLFTSGTKVGDPTDHLVAFGICKGARAPPADSAYSIVITTQTPIVSRKPEGSRRAPRSLMSRDRAREQKGKKKKRKKKRGRRVGRAERKAHGAQEKRARSCRRRSATRSNVAQCRARENRGENIDENSVTQGERRLPSLPLPSCWCCEREYALAHTRALCARIGAYVFMCAFFAAGSAVRERNSFPEPRYLKDFFSPRLPYVCHVAIGRVRMNMYIYIYVNIHTRKISRMDANTLERNLNTDFREIRFFFFLFECP